MVLKTVNISKKEFESLNKYFPPKGVPNTEGQLFILKRNNTKELVKHFYLTEGEYFGRKLLNIYTLMEIKEHINIPEIIFPDKLAIVGNKAVGFSMPYIENNTNLSNYLSNVDVPFKDKIKYLKSIGNILNKINKLKGVSYDIHINDLHEGNFIIDNDTQQLLVIDSDSFYISNNKPFTSKYIFLNPNIAFLTHKYTEDSEGNLIPNKESDFLCYIMIILNFISRTDINSYSLEDFYSYMTFLIGLGYSYEIVETFAKIYNGTQNVNPMDFLDEITEKQYYKSHYLVHKKTNNMNS